MELSADLRKRLVVMLAFDELAIDGGHAAEQSPLCDDGAGERGVTLKNVLLRDAHGSATVCIDAANVPDTAGDDADGFGGHSLAGTDVGAFHLLELIGQGGSSSVYRAVRTAGAAGGSPFVALKVLRTGLYSDLAQRRFRREQEILAALSHPNIARFIECGVSSSGLPYIAMELVDGIPIDVAADQRGLGIRQRLEWFCQLCRAIELAHASRIVHMDLKPANVFVTGNGELKVLDFGMAKRLDERANAADTRSAALTPRYAAPEQYRSQSLTAATDVYALGVVLAELLTARKKAADTSPGALADATAAMRATPPGLAGRMPPIGRIRGDLDDIVSRAIAQDPRLRYATAGAFADDIHRYLAGEPVRAGRSSRTFRARRLIARGRFDVAVICTAVAWILTGLSVAFRQIPGN